MIVLRTSQIQQRSEEKSRYPHFLKIERKNNFSGHGLVAEQPREKKEGETG